MPEKNLIHVGTSGWHYNHWRGPFNPPDLASANFLEFYRQKFQAVEISNSFYHLPTEKTMADWREAVPPGFVFAVKGSWAKQRRSIAIFWLRCSTRLTQFKRQGPMALPFCWPTSPAISYVQSQVPRSRGIRLESKPVS